MPPLLRRAPFMIITKVAAVCAKIILQCAFAFLAVLLLLLHVPCAAVVSPDLFFEPQLQPADPDAAQELSPEENAAFVDLYSALIKGSNAEGLHHANWAAEVASSGSSLCGLLDGAYTYVNDPLSVSRIACSEIVTVGVSDRTPSSCGGVAAPNIASWCALTSTGAKKFLQAIDLDLVPTVFDDGQISQNLVKDPGQIKYLSDKAYCHPKNWYAMISTQKSKSQFRYDTYWGPNAIENFGGCKGVYPQTKCKVSYNSAGILPSSLSQLTALTSLRLRLLGIASQPLPAWIGGMVALTCLDLSFNSFTGSLPSGLFLLTNLVRLHLNDNEISGSLPTQIGLLTSLEILEIGYHSYDQNAYEDYGAIPQHASNALFGSIPTEICLLTKLRQLQLNSNGLTGTLPPCMSVMTALRLVDVRSNALSGALPRFAPPPVEPPRSVPTSSTRSCYGPKSIDPLFFLQKLPSTGGHTIDEYFPADSPYWCPFYLFFVLADNNKFSGPLPSYLAPSLGFAGLPDMYGSLRGATQYRVSASSNALSSINDFSQVRLSDWISVRGNAFTGPIPSFLSSGSLLGTAGAGKIDLSSNRLTGSVPDWIGSAWSFSVNLHGNALSGKIPSGFDKSLFVDLSSNKLTGSVPASFIANIGFSYLTLSNNRIKQSIREIVQLMISNGGNPWTRAQTVSEFDTLDLSGNLIYGTLPGDLFEPLWVPAVESNSCRFNSGGCQGTWNFPPIKKILLNSNSITGTIPNEIGYLTNLVVLDLGNNQISGTLPSTSLASMTTLSTLILRGNRFNSFVVDSTSEPTLAPSPLPTVSSRNPEMYTLNPTPVLPAIGQPMPSQYSGMMGAPPPPPPLRGMVNGQPTDLGALYSQPTPSPLPSTSIESAALQHSQLSAHPRQLQAPEPLQRLTVDLYLGGGSGTGVNDPLRESDITLDVMETFTQAFADALGIDKSLISSYPFSIWERPYLSFVIAVPDTATKSRLTPTFILSQKQTIYDNYNLACAAVVPTSTPDLCPMEKPNLGYQTVDDRTPTQNPTLAPTFPEAKWTLVGTSSGPATQLAFLPNMTALSTADFSASGILGGLPGATPPNLRSITLSGDCNAVFLPESICANSPDLQTIAMDGLRTDNLRSTRCEQSYWSDVGGRAASSLSFTGKYPVLGELSSSSKPTIPACIFQMTALQSLHLSGNGLHGSLPEAITPSLTDLVLSHNFLTGTIPLSVRQRSWGALDLSYNLLSGDIQNFSKPAGPLSLAVNTLSGEIPHTLRNAANISILEGNVFSCSQGEQTLPQSDPYLARFHCGSDTYNSALYSCLAVAAALLLLVLLGGTWRGLGPSGALVEMATVLVYGQGGRRGQENVWEGHGLADLLKSGALTNVTQDTADTTAVLEVADVASAPAPPTRRQLHRGLQVYHLVLGGFNFAAVLIINIGFVLLNANQSAQVQTALKTALAIFKIAWNSGLLPALDALLLPGYTRHSLAEAKAQLYGSSSTFLALLLIFNSVFAPLFSSAVADVTCFKNVFYAPDPVFVSYSYDTCEAFYGSYWWQACLRDKAVVTRFAYTPSFNYTYRCSSTILTLYVPVFIQQFLIATFTGPLLEVLKWALFTHAPMAAVRQVLLGQVSPFLLSRAARAERCLKARADKAAAAERAMRDKQDHRLTLAVLPLVGALRLPMFWKKSPDKKVASADVETAERRASRLQDESDNRKPAFFSGDALLNSIINMVIVLLTFGLVAPLLGVVVVFVLVFQTVLLEATMAAFLRREVEAVEAEKETEKEKEEKKKKKEGEGEEETEENEARAAVDDQTSPVIVRVRDRAAVTGCLHALAHMRRLVLLLGAVVTCVVLPVVVVLSVRFSGLAYPGGWVTTVAYVGGATPAAVLLAVWMAALGAFRGLLYWNGRAGHVHLPHPSPDASESADRALPTIKTLSSGHDDARAGDEDVGASLDAAAYEAASDDALGLVALARDSRAVSDTALHSIAAVMQALSGVFLCFFLMDIMGAAVGWRAALPLAAVALLLPLVLGSAEVVCCRSSRYHCQAPCFPLPTRVLPLHTEPESSPPV